ncbi:hypothetical protein Csa_000521 [Cucumis sativus]|nr:hypothetical protein Csa_000521 [Cucumis sativus]
MNADYASFVATWVVPNQMSLQKEKMEEGKNAGYGVRTHAHLCAEDLKSSPLTSRANQLMKPKIEDEKARQKDISFFCFLLIYCVTHVGNLCSERFRGQSSM